MHVAWLAWYYLIYWLPLAIGVLTLLSAGLGGHRGPSHGRTHTAGHGHARGHRMGHRHHPARGHHAHGQPGQEVHGAFSAVLDCLGFGDAPALVILSCLLLGWGLSGLLATPWLEPSLPTTFPAPVLAVAGGTAIIFTRLMSRLVMRLIPSDETYGSASEDLVGLAARVVYPVSDKGGRVHLYDRVRTLHDRFARVRAGQASLSVGTRVTIVDIDSDHDYLIVHPLD